MDILYIDDDPEDREMFKEAVTLIDSAITCHLAHDGQHGLKTLQELIVSPDFIFVDLNMPVKTGKEFLLEVKQMPGFRSIPVILYSTTYRAEEIKSYATLGAFDFIIKPNSFDAICKILATTFQGQKTGLLSNI